MKILDFNFDFNKFQQNKAALAELFKLQIVQENEKLFDAINFNNDDLFLEPLIFFK